MSVSQRRPRRRVWCAANPRRSRSDDPIGADADAWQPPQEASPVRSRLSGARSASRISSARFVRPCDCVIPKAWLRSGRKRSGFRCHRTTSVVTNLRRRSGPIRRRETEPTRTPASGIRTADTLARQPILQWRDRRGVRTARVSAMHHARPQRPECSRRRHQCSR